jgi:hypothetical protein
MMSQNQMKNLFDIISTPTGLKNKPIFISTPEEAEYIFGKADEIRAVRKSYKRRKVIDDFFELKGK